MDKHRRNLIIGVAMLILLAFLAFRNPPTADKAPQTADCEVLVLC